MPSRGAVAEIPSIEKVEDSGIVTFHIRGREFVVREINASDYEEQLRAASTGEDGKVDMLVLEKLLVMKSVTIDGKPVSDLEAWGKEPYPVASRVVDEVKKLHWLNIETDEEIEQRKREAASAARDAAKEGAKRESLPNS